MYCNNEEDNQRSRSRLYRLGQRPKFSSKCRPRRILQDKQSRSVQRRCQNVSLPGRETG
ncbi:hypothetical protein NXT3_PB00215 (plasmid) [Sinorhizobium fredii]|uniref:Uncharacterized protein n=1 Tax=Rhizobium fredii TaxID=380 RepID=A0A2L0HBQ6_RHIFR|nr:hypothetical protein NXT3_PB00215 [Sinorhizobium fredii]